MSADWEGQRGYRAGTAAPMMAVPVVQGLSLGPFTSGHPFFLESSPIVPWSGSGAEGRLGQAAMGCRSV